MASHQELRMHFRKHACKQAFRQSADSFCDRDTILLQLGDTRPILAPSVLPFVFLSPAATPRHLKNRLCSMQMFSPCLACRRKALASSRPAMVAQIFLRTAQCSRLQMVWPRAMR
ncbi:unnamed protein product [Polarella glacialis]|uniref:Uncharacterized protein n=1 Tax=Polarella glacialis TaxID=89957 RepID=A0A813L258_POLGL|nr:unnamed protein product [Polarella glacialis]